MHKPIIRVVIIDDESAFLKTMEVLMKARPDVALVGAARSVAAGKEVLMNLTPDLVFLDVEMEDGTGFDLLRAMPDLDSAVVFVTAFDQYAIEAFKFSAIDYVLKPVVKEDVYASLDRAIELISTKRRNTELNVLMENFIESNKTKRKIVLKELDTHHIVQVESILWCLAEGSYTRFFLADGQSILVSGNLKEFESMLSGTTFFRVHRSHLVNLDKVVKYEKADGATLYLEGGFSVPVSVRKKEKLAHQLTAL